MKRKEYDKFDQIRFNRRTNCTICGTKHGAPVIKLPEFPLTEIYVTEEVSEKIGYVDQEFHLCKTCGHGQIANVVDPDILYGNSYKTRTSTSSSAIEAVNVFLAFVDSIVKHRPINTILEIGCNDLFTLKKLRHRADKLYGVDPIFKGQESILQDDKIEVIGDFVENVDFKGLGIRADIVISSHTLEHIEEPRQLIRNLISNNSPDTIFFFQFPGLEPLIQDCRFDQIFHQHLNYFSLQSVLYLLEAVGAELIDFKMNYYHWGSLLIAFKKKTNSYSDSGRKFANKIHTISRDYINKQYEVFNKCMEVTAGRIDALQNEIIYGYGAALMLPVLDYYIGKLNRLKFIIDDDVKKKNLYYINLPVQITTLDKVKSVEDSVFLVTAINSLQSIRAIVKKLIQLQVKQIIIPSNVI